MTQAQKTGKALSDIVFIADKHNRHSVRALTAAFEKHYPGRVYRLHNLKNLKYDAVRSLVLCSFTTAHAHVYKAFAREAALHSPAYLLACGGAEPSARPDEAAQLFHSVCVGEGEHALKRIVDDFDNNGTGVGVIQGQRVENLDEFNVFPRLIPWLGAVEIMRGCPGRCHYCQTPMLFPGKIRYRSPEMAAREIAYAAERKSRRGEHADIRFIAPDAGFYRYDRGVNLAEIEKLLLLSRKAAGNGRVFFGTFPSELDPQRVSRELVQLMKHHCDNKTVVIGLQSGSEKMLERMNRKATPADASRAAELFLAAGFSVIVDFIFGLPYEDEKAVEDSINWIKKWEGKVIIHSHPYMPLPGSVWENETSVPLSGRLLTVLKSLEGRGGIFGGYK